MEGCGERIELARRTAPGLFSFDYVLPGGDYDYDGDYDGDVLPGGDGGDHNGDGDGDVLPGDHGGECEMMIVMRKQKGTSYKMSDENTCDDQKSEKCF